MVKKILLLTILLAAVAAGVWYYYGYNSDEAVLRRRVERLEKLLSKEPDSGGVAEALRMEALSGYPAGQCRVESVHELIDATYNPTDFASTVIRGGSVCRSLDIDFEDIEIVITSPDTASATMVGTADAVLKNGDRISETRELTLKLKKIDGDWKITNVRAEKLLK